jgi:hypothetical protein
MSIIPMLTFEEQLEMYPQLKEYMTKNVKVPKLPRLTPPWRVYGQRHNGGRWAKKDFPTYALAFQFWKANRHKYHDMSITCKVQPWDPPGRIVKLTRGGQPLMVRTSRGKKIQATRLIPVKAPADHEWCMYCRRFTVFTWFSKHHAFPGTMAYLMDQTAMRCTICGVRRQTGAFRGR